MEKSFSCGRNNAKAGLPHQRVNAMLLLSEGRECLVKYGFLAGNVTIFLHSFIPTMREK